MHCCTVRLACIRHAASVHPEPGSNSPLINCHSRGETDTHLRLFGFLTAREPSGSRLLLCLLVFSHSSVVKVRPTRSRDKKPLAHSLPASADTFRLVYPVFPCLAVCLLCLGWYRVQITAVTLPYSDVGESIPRHFARARPNFLRFSYQSYRSISCILKPRKG